jgi:uncharacterized RDD family membrane protein YckC
MNTPQLTLKSVTGVDVELQIAGPGTRSYAFIIDWHIRLLFVALWLIGVGPMFGLFSSGFNLSNSPSGVLLFIFLPPVIIYLFYHPVLELAMRGRTPGKRIAGVRVVTRDGEIPSGGAILIRNVFRLVDSMPAFYIVGLVCVLFTDRHVRVGDLASGTLLVIDAAESDKSLAVLSGAHNPGADTLNPQAFELVHEILERWPSLDDATRSAIARSLLIKVDPQATPEQLVASSTADLHSRLRALLVTGDKR